MIFVVNLFIKSAITFESSRHSLDPLTGVEIALTSSTIKRAYPGLPFIYNSISLKEPNKDLLLPFFLSNNSTIPRGLIPREFFSILINPKTSLVFEATVQLFEEQVGILNSWKQLPQGTDPGFSPDEIASIEVATTTADLSVRKRLSVYRSMFGNTSTIVPDLWCVIVLLSFLISFLILAH